MMPSEAPSDWRRLHPSTLVLRAVAYAQKLLVPAVLVFIFARNSTWEYWLLIAFVPSVAFEAFRYYTLRYRFGPDELIVRKGLFFRNERHIPFARIQNINLVQGLLHRWFGVADVSIETAGGKEPEAMLKVLSVDAVEQMRRRVFRESPDAGATAFGPRAPATATPGDALIPASVPAGAVVGRTPIIHLSLRELAILGLVTVRGLALLAVVFGITYELDLWEGFDLSDWANERLARGLSTLQKAVALAAAVVTIPVLAGLSIAWCVLRFHNYRVESEGDDLHVSGGLLTRRAAVIPRGRIQVITVRESILHRLFGRVSIRVETAAGASEQDEAKDRLMAQRWFIPIVPRADVNRILRLVLPRLELDAISWRPLPPRARRRMMTRNTVLAVLLGIWPSIYFWPWGILAPFLFVAWGIWHARRSYAISAWARTSFGIMYRSGVLMRCVSATFFDKVQVVSVHHSPFDRRHGMATLRVDTAGAGPAGHRIHIRYLMRSTAERLAGVLLSKIGRRPPQAAPKVRRNRFQALEPAAAPA